MHRSIRPRLPALLLAAALVLGVPPAAVEAQLTPARAAFQAGLTADGPGVWITSNAQYQEADGGMERYGIDWTPSPGNVAATGCLWGERGSERFVFWHFWQGWDPVEERAIVYQSSPDGTIAVGWSTDTGDGETEVIQVLVEPDGTRHGLRHLSTRVDADTRADRSFTGADGAWVPRRQYTWTRRMDVTSPCG